MPSIPSPLNELLRQQLLLARQLDQQTVSLNTSGEPLDFTNTGKIVSSAYEQLRNAAEYAEEHLLLQRAIRRFCRRNLFATKRKPSEIGVELLIELSHAGYIQVGQFSKSTTSNIDKIVSSQMKVHGQLRKSHVKAELAENWILALISTEIENALNPHSSQRAIIFLAYNHFLQSLSKDDVVENLDKDNYEFCLYIAVQQALLKSDIDIVRYEVTNLYKPSTKNLQEFIDLNKRIDHLFASDLTQNLKRVVGRQGAAFRVLRSMVDDRNDVAQILPSEEAFMEAYDKQISHEYSQVEKRLTRGLIKSIAFIFITKVIIGVGIEVPYDLWLRGSVAVLPLTVNLLLPPLYMASLQISLKMPSSSNRRSLSGYTEHLLYGNTAPGAYKSRRGPSSTWARLVYSVLFAVPVIVTILVLRRVGFNLLQMLIFFIFFSTASFLGFRLQTMVRELSLTPPKVGFFASLRDFFYLPFIMVGQWLSRKYSRINLVARFMDVAIELPLKSVLRLLRQWMRFLREKHEELY